MRLFLFFIIIGLFSCQNVKDGSFKTDSLLTLNKVQDLPILDLSTMYHIDEINGVTPTANAEINIADKETLFIRGWAVDIQEEDRSGGVFIKVDDTIYRAHYQIEREDVAKVFKNDKFQNSGFQCHIPVAQLSKGSHQLEILINTKDRKALYIPNRDKQLLIKL